MTRREKVAMILNKFISDVNEFEITCYMPVGCFHSEFINALLSPRAWHHFTIFSKERSADNFFFNCKLEFDMHVVSPI